MALVIFVILAVIVAALIIAWNTVPSFREKMKGWSTVLEAVLATAVYWYGQVSDALVEAQHAGYLPSQWVGYLPYVIMVWMILKRLQTTTPVGSK